MKWLEALPKRWKIAVLAALGILGILCVWFGSRTQESETAAKTLSTSEYIEQLENKIRTITEQMTGSDNVQVIVRVSSGPAYLYTSGDGSESLLGTSETELTLYREVYPPVEGVSILCRGGDDPNVQAKLIRVLTTALGVTSNRICIVGNES